MSDEDEIYPHYLGFIEQAAERIMREALADLEHCGFDDAST